MVLKHFFDISTGFRYKKNGKEFPVHLQRRPCSIILGCIACFFCKHHYKPWFIYFLPHFSLRFILQSGYLVLQTIYVLNKEIFGSKICSLQLRAVSNKEWVLMAHIRSLNSENCTASVKRKVHIPTLNVTTET